MVVVIVVVVVVVVVVRSSGSSSRRCCGSGRVGSRTSPVVIACSWFFYALVGCDQLSYKDLQGKHRTDRTGENPAKTSEYSKE